MAKKHLINDHRLNANLGIKKRLELSNKIGYEFGIEGNWYGLHPLVLRENFNYSDDEIEAYSIGFSKGRNEYFGAVKNEIDSIKTKILRKQLLHKN
jgi:hypothetical protein